MSLHTIFFITSPIKFVDFGNTNEFIGLSEVNINKNIIDSGMNFFI